MKEILRTLGYEIPSDVKRIDGVSEGLDALLISRVCQTGPVLILCADMIQAQMLAVDLESLGRETDLLEAKDLITHRIYAQSREVMLERTAIFRRLLEQKTDILLTTSRAAAQLMMHPSEWQKATISLKLGQEYDPDQLSKTLSHLGYERLDTVSRPGDFARRGDIIDVFVPGDENPLRLEFFGEELDSIRSFWPQTQASIENLQQAEIFAALETFTDEAMTAEFEELLPEDLTSAPEFSLERDKYLNLIGRAGSLLDIKGLRHVVLLEPGQVYARLVSVREEFLLRFEEALLKGEVLAEEEQNLLTTDRLQEKINKLPVLELSRFSTMEQDVLHLHARRTENYQSQLERFSEDIRERQKAGYRQIALLSDKRLMLHGHLKRQGLTDAIRLEEGEIRHGFIDDTQKIAVYTQADIFGSYRKKRRKRFGENSERITSFFNLKPGDFVVHLHHGIGKYLGIEQKVVEGVARDYLAIEYAHNDRLFVPTEKINLVQRYIGGEVSSARLTRLGTSDWKKKTDRAKKSIEDLTEELIKLYAQREASQGFAFAPDTPWQREFELDFPYEETPDQLRSIEEIKQDMESNRPMDRLLCGDVGFGKTEVAIRAIFKAVMDSKQAAVLVPTTILAEQHYETMRKRFSAYPIKVVMLSRLTTPHNRTVYKEAIRRGEIDVVVGTHMILGKDVEFKDLGLLVVDEEQRFGVKDKERIRKLKTNVDTLAMSATPIPRTLNMSLSGIRDMSLLQDPPQDRYPVQTYITEYDESIVREAILREIERHGQVYYIYNRVEDMSERFEELARLLPDINMVYAHGQMNERQLESAILGFIEGTYQVLVSSTIVETGMDISNVNTIIIENAQNFGLSQLYQLRGRVGRTNRIAYAYLLYPKAMVLSPTAMERLDTIREFTNFGSGFKIAIRDLEIRGSGNVLGSSQSGHFEEVGYELYMQMLKDKMDQIRGTFTPKPREIPVDINISALIPKDYIRDDGTKMDMYQKVREISSEQDKLLLEDEFTDRFGTMPEAVENLVLISYIRALSEQIPLKEIKSLKDNFELLFDEDNMPPTELISYVFSEHRDIKIVLKRRPHLLVPYRHKAIDREKDALALAALLKELVFVKG